MVIHCCEKDTIVWFILFHTTPLLPVRDMVQSRTRHPLFTNRVGCRSVRSGAAEQPGGSHSARTTHHSDRYTDTGHANMPCRKENYIFLEQSVTVGSKEVDALVTKIGEALQLHNNSGGHQKTVSVSMSCLHGLTGGSTGGVKPAAISGGGGGPGAPRHGCCMRLRTRGHRGSSRASPYNIPGSNGDQDWDQIKPWNRKRITVEEDDPHRLLQELILSGNLIKEAVRRLQFPAADCADFPTAADNVPSWYGTGRTGFTPQRPPERTLRLFGL